MAYKQHFASIIQAGTMIDWTSIVIFTCVFAYLYFRHKFSYWSNRGLKNPRPIPWFGTTLHHVFRPKPELEKIHHREYGKLYGLYDGFLGTNPTLVCGHPEAIKQITIKHFDSFVNRRKPATWKSIRFRALTYMRDEEWRTLRRILAPVFTSNKLKKMFESMKRCTKNLSDSVQYQGDSEIDLKRLFSVFTVDVISTCCFSMELKDFRHPESLLLINARKFFNVSRLKMALFAAMPKQVLSRINFDINDVGSIEFFERFSTEIINQRKKLTADSSGMFKVKDDFLQTLIDAAAEFCDRKEPDSVAAKLPQSEERSYSVQELGDLEILAQTMLFFAVGHETTATLLSSCGYFLALYPDLQDRLYKEVHEAIEEDKGNISYEKLMNLPYLDAFVSEALRYFTPTLVFDREAREDVEIEVDDLRLTIPKGMGVVIPFLAVHHDPDNYENPEVFDPDRFMPENKHKIKPCTFIPFGSGPRHCLASRFALIESKLALATLIERFKFVKSEGTVWPPIFRHHYMLLQMEWPKIKFIDRKISNLDNPKQADLAA